MVNVAGFVAAIVACLSLGWMLDLRGSVSLASYRLAFAVAVSVQAIGLIQMVRWWLLARHWALRALAEGRPIPVPVVRHRWDLSAERAGRRG